MFGKAFGFALIVYLVQFTNGSIVDSIKELQEATHFTSGSNGTIADLIEELRKVLIYIANVTIDGERQVKHAYVSIQKSLRGYEKDLIQQRADLVKTIIEAQANASRSGKNISACLDQAQNSSLELLVLDLEFKKCGISEELSNLTISLVQIGYLEEEVLETIPTCLSVSESNDERFRKCVSESFDAATKYIDAVQDRIEPAIAYSVQVATKCGKQRSAAISETVSQMKSDFNDCVSKV